MFRSKHISMHMSKYYGCGMFLLSPTYATLAAKGGDRKVATILYYTVSRILSNCPGSLAAGGDKV